MKSFQTFNAYILRIGLAPSGKWDLLVAALALFLLNQTFEAMLLTFKGLAYGSLCNFDCGWYSTIVSHGYDLAPHAHLNKDAANWAFFPAFPMIARAVQMATGWAPQISLIVASKLFFLTSLYFFMVLVREYEETVPPVLSGGILAFGPLSIYANTGYTETLYFTITCFFFMALRRQRYMLAGLLVGGMTSIKVTGGAGGLAYIADAYDSFRRGNAETRMRILLGAMLVPLGLSGFIMFLNYWIGDGLAFIHIQRAWGREMNNPFIVLWDGLTGDIVSFYLAVFALLSMGFTVKLFVNKNYAMAIFLGFSTLIPLMTGLQSIPRYVWWQVPFVFSLSLIANRYPFILICTPFLILGLVLYYLGWFQTLGFVI